MKCGTRTLTECIKGTDKVRNTAPEAQVLVIKGGELKKKPAK
jgi:hypothetical protein